MENLENDVKKPEILSDEQLKEVAGGKISGETYETGLTYSREEGVEVLNYRGSNAFVDGHESVALDSYYSYVVTRAVDVGIDLCNLSGYRGVDGRRNKAARLSDELTDLYSVAYLNHGGSGCAEVLRHREEDFLRGFHLNSRHVRCVLVMRNVGVT